MNRYSRTVTEPKTQGASQAMLYATEGVNNEEDFQKAMVGVASVWCVLPSFLSTRSNRVSGMKATRKQAPTIEASTETNLCPFVSVHPRRCNRHLLGLGQLVKKSLTDAGLIGYQFGTVGVSDGISMGTRGMSYSLQSRDLIADQVETAAGGHWLDGMVVIPGCDKNMPGVLMACKPPTDEYFIYLIDIFAVGRLNRPGLMVYGGTIRPGSCEGAPQLDVVSAFQSYGKYLQDGRTDAAEHERRNTVRHACPGPGACGGVSLPNSGALHFCVTVIT